MNLIQIGFVLVVVFTLEALAYAIYNLVREHIWGRRESSQYGEC